jgi:cytochrome c-type biogenesis protein CcmF
MEAKSPRRKLQVVLYPASIIVPLAAIALVFSIPDPLGQASAIFALGNTFFIIMIVSTTLDVVILVFRRRTIFALPFVTFSTVIATFVLMECCFLADKFYIFYVWVYSSIDTPLVYKTVAIWAGEAGSILTWMTFNSTFVLAFRSRGRHNIEASTLFASIVGSIVMVVFQVLLMNMAPFEFFPPFTQNGRGLNEVLRDPFMIWHPLFMFLAYAAYLIPFSLTFASIFKKVPVAETRSTQKFIDFSLRFGWLVLTLGIGIGSYWAKLALSWGRFWGWDPVETVSLVPWFFATSIFHARSLDKGKLHYYKLNLLLVFVGIVFSTFVTRGGGLTSLHAFTGGVELVLWVLIAGVILLVASFLAIYKSIDDIIEGYKDSRRVVNLASYLCFLILVFICIIGLTIPPLTLVLSFTGLIVPINLNPNFYVTGMLVPALGLSISLSFCTLIKHVKPRTITIAFSVVFLGGLLVTAILASAGIPSFNPFVGVYAFSMAAPFISIGISARNGTSVRTWFKRNARDLVHAGISSILVGSISGETALQTIMYIAGFLVLVGSMVPAIFVSLTAKPVIDENVEVKDVGRNPDPSD